MSNTPTHLEQKRPKRNVLPKPDWIRVKAPVSKTYRDLQTLMRKKNLHTVCEEAACPNIGECWEKKHATFMILGDTCTRGCRFCNIKTAAKGLAVNIFEPVHVAEAIEEMGLRHVVITSVDRDDLPDGGADQFVRTLRQIRKRMPQTTIEILTPDFLDKDWSLSVDRILIEKPDVYNHNMETIARLYKAIRPQAHYKNSLNLLRYVKTKSPATFTKSGIMVGLGETPEEVFALMDDLRAAKVDFMTIGQYLQPTPQHARVQEYVTPETFSTYERVAREKGFLMVSSSPLTRSSYHADKDFEALQQRRHLEISA